jgi:hypothetical protein
MTEPGQRLNLKAPHSWLGPKDENGHLWALQDGAIYAWSDSNVAYEFAWWLNADGTPAKGRTPGQQSLFDNINTQRPFNTDWLKDPVIA